MKSKRQLECTVKVLDYLIEYGKIDDKKARELAGDYWNAIRRDLSENAHVQYGEYGASSPFPKTMLAYKAVCKDEIERIEKEEYDRELDNKSKHAAIKANRIAKCAITISVLAATGLPQYLLKWLYKIFLELVCLLNN